MVREVKKEVPLFMYKPQIYIICVVLKFMGNGMIKRKISKNVTWVEVDNGKKGREMVL